jgi:osmotically-inducible protein OsmY
MLADERIKRQIVEKLNWDERVNGADVKVASREGRVVLAGTVPDYLAFRAAELDSLSVPGVKDVANQLTIRYPTEVAVPSDDELAMNIENKLLWSSDIDHTAIDISVDAGIAILEGVVDSYWKKAKAEVLAYDVIGVTLVENRLGVVPTRNVIDEAIAESIIEALNRHGNIDIGAIDVAVEKGRVILSGEVPDWNAHMTAHDVAAHTTGVVGIRNELVVSRSREEEKATR